MVETPGTSAVYLGHIRLSLSRDIHALRPYTCSHRQTIDLTECTSLICGVPRWCELICIISHLKRDVLEAGGGLMVRAGVYKVPIVQSQDRGKCPVGCVCVCVCD